MQEAPGGYIVCFVVLSSLIILFLKYVGLISQPLKFLPSSIAAAQVVPDPEKKSRTVSPGLECLYMSSFIIFRGF